MDEAKKLAAEIEQKREIVAEDLKELTHIITKSDKTDISKIKEGDFVKFQNGAMYGQVLKIKKDKAVIQSENFQFELPLIDLRLSGSPIETNKKSSIRTSLSGTPNFESKLDIRGYTKSEALETLHIYFDNALLSGVNHLTILHGKGNGTLRKLVRQIAKEYNIIDEIWHPEHEHGGDGITHIKAK